MGGFVELFSQFDIGAAVWMTIKLSILSMLGSLILGLIIAIMRVSPIKVFQKFAAGWVAVTLNLPLTLIASFCFFAMFLLLGVKLLPDAARNAEHAFAWGVVALSVYHSAFVAEGIRSGVNTVPLGQAEAARAIGLTFTQSLSQVILPQAMRGAIAPLGNAAIALTKNTTVLATVSVAEMSVIMQEMLEMRIDLLFHIFFIMASVFVILTLPMGIFFTWLSEKLAVAR